MNLIRRLSEVCPTWRADYGHNPLDAAIELGLIEPEDVDEPELDFERWVNTRDRWRERGDYGDPPDDPPDYYYDGDGYEASDDCYE